MTSNLRTDWVQPVTAPERPSNKTQAQVLYETLAAPAPDPVNNPAHYKQGEVECIDAIKSALTPEEFRGYCKGNALKYIWREKHKGGDESLRKAVWYLRPEMVELP